MTSHAAAASVGPLSELQQFVAYCLEDAGPSTDEELVAYIEVNYPQKAFTPQSVRSRRSELVRKGKVRPLAGVFRDTSAGHRSQVWTVR